MGHFLNKENSNKLVIIILHLMLTIITQQLMLHQHAEEVGSLSKNPNWPFDRNCKCVGV